MSRFLWRALDAVRGYGSPNSNSVLLLQTLAWHALSAKGLVDPPELEGLAREPYLNTLKKLGEVSGYSLAFKPEGSDLALRELPRLISITEGFDANEVQLEDYIALLSRQRAPYYGSPSLEEAVVEMVNLQGKKLELYVPFNGSLFIALRLALCGHKVSAEFESENVVKQAQLLSILLSSPVNAKVGEPVEEPEWTDEQGNLLAFDLSVALPPFGCKYNRDRVLPDRHGRFPESSLYGEVLQLSHLMAQSRRLSIAVIPNGFLFRSAAGEKAFKQDLVSSGKVDSVIAFPSGFFLNTGLESNIIVLKPSTRGKSVLMMDLAKSGLVLPGTKGAPAKIKDAKPILKAWEERKDTKFARVVSEDEIFSNNFDLTPSRYVLSDEGAEILEELDKCRTEKLENLVEFIRPKYLKPSGEAEYSFVEFSVSDIGDDGLLGSPSRELRLSKSLAMKARSQTVQGNDVLLVVKGHGSGKAGLVEEELPGDTLANQSFLILRLRTNRISAPYLMRYLNSPVGSKLSELRTGGSGVPMIPFKEIRSLPIVIPSAETLAKVEDTHRKILETHQEIQKLLEIASEQIEQVGTYVLGGSA